MLVPNIGLLGAAASVSVSAVLVGLEQVGLQSVAAGFRSEFLRVVVVSTDDEYKTPGYPFCNCTSLVVPRAGGDCSCANACTADHCSRIPELSEVRSALLSANVTPIFAIAPPEAASTPEGAAALRRKYTDLKQSLARLTPLPQSTDLSA